MSESLSLPELAAKYKQLSRSAVGCDCSKFSGDHNVAAVLNGWNKFERVFGPVSLTEDDYLGAIEAAKNGEAFEPANFREPRGEE
jgi:hypothetical protein